MLYDEEGNVYVEPPLLPEEQHLFYIVSDYQAMYKENVKLRFKNNKLKESLRRVNSQQFAYYRIICQYSQYVDKLLKMLKKSGQQTPIDAYEYNKQIRKKLLRR